MQPGKEQQSFASLVLRLRAVFAPFAAVPFFFAGGQRPTDRQRAGSGQYRLPGAIAAGVATVVTHDLKRVPVCCNLVDNGTTVQTPLLVTARTATQVTVTPTGALDAACILYLG